MFGRGLSKADRKKILETVRIKVKTTPGQSDIRAVVVEALRAHRFLSFGIGHRRERTITEEIKRALRIGSSDSIEEWRNGHTPEAFLDNLDKAIGHLEKK